MIYFQTLEQLQQNGYKYALIDIAMFLTTKKDNNSDEQKLFKQIYDVVNDNLTLALTSPSPYIREWAEFICKNDILV